jgi:hypothetical protein
MPKHGGKSDLDAQRDFLDSLMGINRNNDREKDNIRDFRDERVCRFFLTGMCPHGKIKQLFPIRLYALHVSLLNL